MPQYPSQGYTGEGAMYSYESTTSFNQLGVSGYTDDGVMHDDGSPENGTGIWRNQHFWDNDYEYFWDERDQCWWKYDSRLDRWYRWIDVLGWHWTIFDYGDPPHFVQKAYQENPCPLDDEIYILVGLVTIYEICKMKKVWEEKVKTKKSMV